MFLSIGLSHNTNARQHACNSQLRCNPVELQLVDGIRVPTEYSQRVRDRVSRKGRKTMTEGAIVLYDCYFIRFTVLYWAAMGTQRQTDSTDNLVQERHTASGMREECDLEMWIERIL